MPTPTQHPSGVLDIVRCFRHALRSAMPTDAQAYFLLPANLPLHVEMMALLLQEPWLVDLFMQCYEDEAGSKATKHRLQTKASALALNIFTEQRKMQRIVKKLMALASVMQHWMNVGFVRGQVEINILPVMVPLNQKAKMLFRLL